LIYVVVPKRLEAELYEQLAERYKDDSNVRVIVERRAGRDRRSDHAGGGQRAVRERRRARIPGTFLPIDPPAL
jgi:hypothetical protein